MNLYESEGQVTDDDFGQKKKVTDDDVIMVVADGVIYKSMW